MAEYKKASDNLYYDWLSSKVTTPQLTILRMAYNEISNFCKSRNIVKEPLLEIYDIDKLTTVLDTVKNNNIFRLRHKRDLDKMLIAIRFYISYIQENNVKLISEKNIENNAVQSVVKENNSFKTSDTLEKYEDMITVDLSEVRDYTFTRPIKYEYFGNVYCVKKWKELYISCCKRLWENYSDKLLLLNDYSNKNDIWFCKIEECEKYNLYSPKEIANGFVTETNFNATDLMRKLRTLVAYCHIDYNKIFITFVKKNNQESKISIVKPLVSNLTNDSERSIFYQWLSKNNIKSNIIATYLSVLNQVQNYINGHGLSDVSLYSIMSVSELESIFIHLSNDDEFIEWISNKYNRFEIAFKKYIEFRSLNNTEDNDMISACESNCLDLDDVDMQRYSDILETYFPDGLKPMVIHLNKFKLVYKDVYGESLEIDNDVLSKNLEKIGTLIDGRIFACKNTNDTAIIREIDDRIISTFDNGASCIFLECLMAEYGQRLSSELGIYNEDSLASVLLLENKSYYRRNDYLQQGNEVPDISRDVLDTMKNSYTPLNYAQLKSVLWYLPIDKIKSALLSVPDLVNVDKETYFYAPNLPVTNDEINALKKAMHIKIAERGFLVAKDIPILLKKVAPAAAINTCSFKDWALRNVLRYILRDEFSFGASVVCENGDNIEMGQVYRNYCTQFEHMYINDLKDFSSEIGVPVYWYDVMDEMIRVSATEFVRKDCVQFDVEKIDAVLENFCPNDYIPIKEVDLFLHFPVTGIAWNGFVLESYLLNFSEQFCLYQVSIAESDFFGVIVRKSSNYNSYTDVVVDMLAHSKEWKDEKSALELLVQKGYQARRLLGNIDALLKTASLKREEINKEIERG